MSNGNKVMQLPPEVRRQLDDKLRAANYGDMVPLSAWITAEAFPVSKSSLQRYAAGLRARDLARGNENAQLLVAIKNSGAKAREALTGRRAQLLLRLARIELERVRLLEELAPMMIGDDFNWDDPTLEGLAGETLN